MKKSMACMAEVTDTTRNYSPLHGWMNMDGDEYHEPCDFPGGILIVSKRYWSINLMPNKVRRIGYWVNDGYTIYGRSLERFKKCLKKNYIEARKKADKNPNDTWKTEDNFDIQYGYSCGRLYAWPVLSQVWLYSEAEIDAFIRKIDECEKRVQEIREMKGWKEKNLTNFWRLF